MKIMKTNSYESYVVLSPNDNYYSITTKWIPEGDLDVIRETSNIEQAAKFSDLQEIYDYEKLVQENDDPYFRGEFKPKRIMKIKSLVTYEEVEEVFIF